MGMIWKETVKAYFRTSYKNVIKGFEENHEILVNIGGIEVKI
jgi:hypothetical protein